MGLRDAGLKAASRGISKKGVHSAAKGGGERKGAHSIEFKKSFGQHILKNPMASSTCASPAPQTAAPAPLLATPRRQSSLAC
jgi:hypothetical protein